MKAFFFRILIGETNERDRMEVNFIKNIVRIYIYYLYEGYIWNQVSFVIDFEDS